MSEIIFFLPGRDTRNNLIEVQVDEEHGWCRRFVLHVICHAIRKYAVERHGKSPLVRDKPIGPATPDGYFGSPEYAATGPPQNILGASAAGSAGYLDQTGKDIWEKVRFPDSRGS